MGNRSYVRCEAPDMESCRSVFLAKLDSVMTRRLPVRCGKWPWAGSRRSGLRTLDSCSAKKSISPRPHKAAVPVVGGEAAIRSLGTDGNLVAS
jgi:hypothetical protein